MMKPKSAKKSSGPPSLPSSTPVRPKKKCQISDYPMVVFYPKQAAPTSSTPMTNDTTEVKLSNKEIHAKLARQIALDKRIEKLEESVFTL
ncbi:hypothetical protein CVT24_012808 [Panaeolus cyanescens]|uniref:Uncharacterized protein n=1 Tax=Panaeolus cyanescens TaxID=181874 RepID=A0A409WUQ5_9AGAR|nr:hypothetical protein CVT24_012808 [Panaeolus cyanescens]